RPNRPNRHRDHNVFNDEQQVVSANTNVVAEPIKAPAEKQLKVEVIDAPQHAPLTTALVVNVDQAQSEILALNQPQPKAPAKTKKPASVENKTDKTVEVTAPVVIEAKIEPVVVEQVEHVQEPVKRASNDPRQKRREQRAAAQAKAETPKITPSQVPTLNQYTVGTLIRAVYGDDCAVLIEQFGLIPTFNRALLKFTEEYAATLTVAASPDVQEKQPVTRDVAITKAAPEAQPAEILDLTP
ncbi:MAG: ribonuclease E/G, partial [Acinetobacter sp.]